MSDNTAAVKGYSINLPFQYTKSAQGEWRVESLLRACVRESADTRVDCRVLGDHLRRYQKSACRLEQSWDWHIQLTIEAILINFSSNPRTHSLVTPHPFLCARHLDEIVPPDVA